MTEDQSRESRFTQGVELMRQLLGDDAANRAIEVHHLPSGDPRRDSLEWSVENAFGFLMHRPGLSMRDRGIALVASDIASAVCPRALREHARLAILNGVTPDELREISLLLTWYCGVPRVREGNDAIDEAIGDCEKNSGPPWEKREEDLVPQ